MNKLIENPKVFISYSWSSDEYVEKVMNFASRLQSDGIKVIIDKWTMEPGNDTISFMEKSVKDPNINFVLMLLDKEYTEKADGKVGGVGIETQIISSEVYNDVEQNKFIPIIFDRDEDGKMYVPTYLKSRFYIDMTINDPKEYVKLVKYIYGRKMYYEPELGVKPAWVDENFQNPSSLKSKILNENTLNNIYEDLIEEIVKFELKNYDEGNEKILKQYQDSQIYRDTLIEIYFKSYLNEDFVDETCEFYENLKKWNKNNNGIKQEIWDAFIHETFIYLISILLKNKQFEKINIFITKSYFQNDYAKSIVSFREYFYSYNYDRISDSKCKNDEKNYINGMAELWMENIYLPKISKELFTEVDLLLYNMSIMLLDENWYWFPITYIYSGNFNFESSLKNFSIRLKSKYEVGKFYKLFGTSTVEELKILFNKLILFNKDKNNRYRYPNAFNYAELITDYIKIEDIASLN